MKFKSQPIFEWLIERAREDPGLTRIQQGHNQRLILSCPGIKHWSFYSSVNCITTKPPHYKKKNCSQYIKWLITYINNTKRQIKNLIKTSLLKVTKIYLK